MSTMDMFRVPGSALVNGADIRKFDEIKTTLDRCTNDILIRPDWERNMQLVDLVNTITNDLPRNEVMFLIRRKLSSSKAKTVFLTISLVEALVKNGDVNVHSAIGTESFMKEMAKVARKYSGKGGSENIEVAELSLDVIQAWGEAFLSRQRQFPGFVKVYHDLRKEGLRFKAQYDVNRVPIFTPSAADQSDGSGNNEYSGILKAAMASTMELNAADSYQGRSRKGACASADLLESMVTASGVLCSILISSPSASSLRSNEIASEVAVQLRSLQNGLGAAIEYELTHDPEGTELLFKMNDDSQALLAAFDGVIDGTCTLVKAIETVSVLAATLDSGSSSSSGPPIAPSSSSPEKEDASNLLDLLDSSPSEDTSVVWNKPAVPALKSPQYSSSSFTLRPPPSEAPPAAKAIFDPFDTDPFGPGTSSIDDLLSSSSSSTAAPQKVFAPQTSDMFAGMSGLSISGQGQGQGQAQDRTTPLSTAPTSETVQSMDTASASVASKPIVDLNALIFSSNNNNTSSAFPGYYGQGIQQQQQQQQFPQQPQQWQGISSPIPMPMPNNSYQYPPQQAPYQQQQQQFSVSPPQGNIYSTSPHSMYSPPQIPYPPPPLPSSLPPPAPQYNAQKNPFDSF